MPGYLDEFKTSPRPLIGTGAEGDVGAYLVMKYFPAKIFGSVNSLISAGAGGAIGLGGILLSLSFRIDPSFDLFLVAGAIAIFTGSMLFLFLGRCRPMPVEEVEARAGAAQRHERRPRLQASCRPGDAVPCPDRSETLK